MHYASFLVAITGLILLGSEGCSQGSKSSGAGGWSGGETESGGGSLAPTAGTTAKHGSASGGAIAGGGVSAGGASAGKSASAAGSASGGASAVSSSSGSAHAVGETLFPSTSIWYQDISGAALAKDSTSVINGLQSHGGWGTGRMQIDFSIEVLQADASVKPRTFTKTDDFYEPDCDFVPMPVPPGGNLEGESNYACTQDGDCHLIVIQGTKLFEMWRTNIVGGTATGTFNGGCLAVWDLTRDYWKSGAGYARGDQCTSADAAGYPITALLFSADEVKAGAINHAIRFILPNARIRKGEYIHPATHSGAGPGTPSPDYVPYGARFRLKSSFNLASLPNEGARTVAKALQRYGMFLADGGNIALTAQADTHTTAKWDGLLGARDLGSIQVTDFEMVDGGPGIPLTLDCVRTAM